VVTLAQLRDLKVETWTTAANEWNDKAVKLLGQAKNLRDLVRTPLNGGWTGVGGEQAKAQVQHLMEMLEIDSLECKAVALVLHGCAHAFQIEQSSLHTALATASKGEFRVDDDGTVHLPTNPMVRHDPDYNQWAREQQQRIQKLIDDAVEMATKTDTTAHDELDKLSTRTNVTKIDDAENGDLGDASKTEISLIAGTVPTGNKDQIADWWNSLTDDDRKTLEGAVPWQLEGLDGIPADVKNQLHGSDGYDRTGVAGWARDHWNDNSDDPFRDNCTNFASNALAGGGLPQHADFWAGNFSGDSWSKGSQTGWGFFDEHDYSHSASWAQAQTSYNFWTEPGHGSEVDPSDVRPGDIIYFEQTETGYDIAPGTVHHAAVVTSVVDGTIYYTQHSGNQIDASLDGRDGVNALNGGQNKVHVVRPDPDWAN
jgi:hypothetical protein